MSMSLLSGVHALCIARAFMCMRMYVFLYPCIFGLQLYVMFTIYLNISVDMLYL